MVMYRGCSAAFSEAAALEVAVRREQLPLGDGLLSPVALHLSSNGAGAG